MYCLMDKIGSYMQDLLLLNRYRNLTTDWFHGIHGTGLSDPDYCCDREVYNMLNICLIHFLVLYNTNFIMLHSKVEKNVC